MDIISTLGNTISLAKRLKEISKNVSEAEFQNLLADLLNQLATIKVEVADLKDQLVALQEENKALKNKEVNEAESFSQLAKLLQNIKVTIPSSINTWVRQS
jgi:predicted  nucleic acid-binding Zn-ribbon protein